MTLHFTVSQLPYERGGDKPSLYQLAWHFERRPELCNGPARRLWPPPPRMMTKTMTRPPSGGGFFCGGYCRWCCGEERRSGNCFWWWRRTHRSRWWELWVPPVAAPALSFMHLFDFQSVGALDWIGDGKWIESDCFVVRPEESRIWVRPMSIIGPMEPNYRFHLKFLAPPPPFPFF